MKLQKLSANWLLAAVGTFAWTIGTILYWRSGFNTNLWIVWGAGCLALLVAAWRMSPPGHSVKLTRKNEPQNDSDDLVAEERVGRRDWFIAGALLLVFAPLYFIGVHDFPRQVNTDEIAIMYTERTLTSTPSVDIYGPSYYSDLPAFIFWFLGKIGVALGGVSLTHMRLVHAASGLLIIALIYVFCRLLRLPRSGAVVAACVVALNHSFYIFARSAMRDNTAVLFELLALICLYAGWHRRHYGWTLLGGFLGGLTFYTYYPSRMTLVLWLVFVAAAVIFRYRNFRNAARFAAISVFGAFLFAAPLFIANAHHTPTDPYPTHQFLWQKAAREQEWRFRGTKTMAQALEMNATHGLLAFNLPYADQSYLYINPGYGFVDILTGMLLWFGVAAIIIESARQGRLSEADLLALTGFLVIWLSLSLLVTRAPDYTRLFIVMPFVGYIIGRLVCFVVRIGARSGYISRVPVLPWAVAVAMITAVAAMNVMPVRAYARIGNQDGDGVGDTLRFQEQHATEKADWLFAPGLKTPYFSWGIWQYWQGWLQFGKGADQPLQMITVGQLAANQVNQLPKGTQGYLLTTGDTWDFARESFVQNWHVENVHYFDPAHHRVVVTYTAK